MVCSGLISNYHIGFAFSFNRLEAVSYLDFDFLANADLGFNLCFMAKKINKTVAFFLALLIGFIWALALASLVGVIYNI